MVSISAQSILCKRTVRTQFAYQLLCLVVTRIVAVAKDLYLAASPFSSFTPVHLQQDTFELVHATNNICTMYYNSLTVIVPTTPRGGLVTSN